jgi:hypothetical protein
VYIQYRLRGEEKEAVAERYQNIEPDDGFIERTRS